MAINKALKNLSDKKIGNIFVDMAKPELLAYAKKIEKDIEEKSKEAIDYFYADYPDPKVYKRVYSMGSTHTSYMFKSRIKETDEGYRLTFEYSADQMTGEHRCTNDLIFDQAFMEGFHGGYKGIMFGGIEVPHRSTPPWELIINYVEKAYSK